MNAFPVAYAIGEAIANGTSEKLSGLAARQIISELFDGDAGSYGVARTLTEVSLSLGECGRGVWILSTLPQTAPRR